jgi:oxalate decarboxylase/phosphoglucose isomerase-like protein (cupin superfamily)
VPDPYGTVPRSFTHRLLAQEPIRTPGGSVRIVDSANFPISTAVWFLEMFKSDRFADVSLNQWMALTPRQLVQETLHVGPELLDALRKQKWPVVKYPVADDKSPKQDG